MTVLAALAGTLLVTKSQDAAAQSRQPVGISVELLGSLPVDSENSDRFGAGLGGAVNLEYDLNQIFGIHLGLLGLTFGGSSDMPDLGTEWVDLHAGGRLHWTPLIDKMDADGWVDFHANLGTSGGIRRGGTDFGIGYEFNAKSSMRFGPVIRFHFGTDPIGNHAQIITIGLTATLLGSDRYDPNAFKDTDGDGVIDRIDDCPETPAGPNPDPDKKGCPGSDKDKDGVMDYEDMCEETPQGDTPDPNKPGCPADDRDEDGVLDHEDECPLDHKGPMPDPERKGCPSDDRDEDLVPDDEDACPDEPGAPSSNRDTNGCPGLVRIIDGEIRVMEPVFFNNNSTAVMQKSYPVLEAVLDAADSLGIKEIRVEGHADARGDEDYNMELSENRANAVARWLDDQGVDATIIPVGYGEARPMEENDSDWGRSQNRRVVFRILDAEYVGDAERKRKKRRGL